MRWVLRLIAAAAVFSAGMGSAQPAAQKRVALIVANAIYTGYAPLPNTTTDAGLVRETLTRAGFGAITLQSNLDFRSFRRALSAFAAAAASADVALVYFAGHGVEAAGRNWLIPVDATLSGDADLHAQAIDAGSVFSAMQGARVRIAVLDACRDNPFVARLRQSPEGARSIGRGLGAPTADDGLAFGSGGAGGNAPQGALLMYSAAPGEVAADGPAGQGSPFARAFQAHFAEPETELRVAIGRIAEAVTQETGGAQAPFLTLSLSGTSIFLVPQRAAPLAPTTAGAEFRDCVVCPLMVVVPAGKFVMGSPLTEAGRFPDEGPQREVTIAAPLAVGKFEITFAEWDACGAEGGCVREQEEQPYRPSDFGWGRGNRPVMNISWRDAMQYVRWLNRRVGGEAYRLPTSAEWEYAARANSQTAFSWGALPSRERANYGKDECCGGYAQGGDRWEIETAPVGSFPPNAFNLHDMHGNVWERVQDCWAKDYVGAPTNGAAVMRESCGLRVHRGGSWTSDPSRLRAAAQAAYAPDVPSRDIGFRVVRSLPR